MSEAGWGAARQFQPATIQPDGYQPMVGPDRRRRRITAVLPPALGGIPDLGPPGSRFRRSGRPVGRIGVIAPCRQGPRCGLDTIPPTWQEKSLPVSGWLVQPAGLRFRRREIPPVSGLSRGSGFCNAGSPVSGLPGTFTFLLPNEILPDSRSCPLPSPPEYLWWRPSALGLPLSKEAVA